MKFFRHDTYASQSPALVEAEEQFGHLGYAAFFKILGLVYRKFDLNEESFVEELKTNAEPVITLSWKVVVRTLKTKPAIAERLLTVYNSNTNLQTTRNGHVVEVKIRNLMKFLSPQAKKRFSELLIEKPKKALEEKRLEEKRREENKLMSSETTSDSTMHWLAEFWNANRKDLSAVRTCNASRITKSEKRVNDALKYLKLNKNNSDCKEKLISHFTKVVNKIHQSDFCSGRNDRNWKANFSFFIKPDTQWKLLEGEYENNKNPLPPGPKRTQSNNVLLEKFQQERKGDSND